nr:immunoglobulin light chain junction region [Macaca mulatta]
CMQVREFPFTF